jgi:hypothetical protein
MRSPPIASLPQRERERIVRELLRLERSNNCSVCGSPLKHNSRTVGGLDQQGRIELAGQCCFDRVIQAVNYGNYFTRQYDFRPAVDPNNLTLEQAAAASKAFQEKVERIDKELEDIERHSGTRLAAVTKVYLNDYLWTVDDELWFERNRERSHRVRLPFPSEFDAYAASSAEHELVVLVRQITRLTVALSIPIEWLPVPNDEAVGHCLFEIAVGNEEMPPDGKALSALIDKYVVREGESQ